MHQLCEGLQLAGEEECASIGEEGIDMVWGGGDISYMVWGGGDMVTWSGEEVV